MSTDAPLDSDKPANQPGAVSDNPPGLSEANSILGALQQAIVTTDKQGIVQYVNPATEALTGIPAQDAIGNGLTQILRPLVGSGTHLNQLIQQLLNSRGKHSLPMRKPDNPSEHLILDLSPQPLSDAQGEPIGLVIQLSERELISEVQELIPLDNLDPLTGLMNRNEFEKRLNGLVQDAAISSRTHAFLMLDMDQFKLVNDLSGHKAGDILLQQIGDCLAGSIHIGDTIARLGGDEFGFLISNLEANEVNSVANRLLTTLQNTLFNWDGLNYPLTASIGIVPIDENTQSTTRAMSQGDTALYAAKDAGRNRYHVYKASDEELTRRHSEMEWTSRITQALANDDFRLVTQAITPLQTASHGEHFEVLIRLQEGDKLIAPGEFLPAAERYGLMDKIDRWVITTFLDYLEHNPEAAQQMSLCSINLSGASIAEAEFLEFLIQQVNRAHVRPETLCFEVTETAAIVNLTGARHFCESIQAMGCKFSLDDFGSGMSSFGYLREIPVDYLKIDGVFVCDLDSNKIHRAMVKAINEVGHAMDKKTIAEFVVNQKVMDILQDMGVDYGQGYHIGKPKLLDKTQATGDNAA